jgi:hypothetical protein
MNDKIVKAECLDKKYLLYSAKGKLARVFDTNGNGDLIPVAYDKCHGTDGDFYLHFAPHGIIYAQVTY